MVNFGEFLKSSACGQTQLPDRSILIGQKFNCDFLRDFQRLWNMRKVHEDLSHIVYTYVTNVTRGLPGLKPRHDPHSEVFPSQHWQPPFLQNSKKWWENWKTWLRVVKQCGTSKQKFSFTFSDHYCWWGCRFAFVTFPSPLLSWVPFLS